MRVKTESVDFHVLALQDERYLFTSAVQTAETAKQMDQLMRARPGINQNECLRFCCPHSKGTLFPRDDCASLQGCSYFHIILSSPFNWRGNYCQPGPKGIPMKAELKKSRNQNVDLSTALFSLEIATDNAMPFIIQLTLPFTNV